MAIKEIADVLDEAMYTRKKIAIKTKERGVIVGIPHNVDEFDTDPDRLGYFIMIEPQLGDTVFLDEITEISDYNPIIFVSIPQDAKIAAGI